MKEPSVLFFSFSPHMHTASLLQAEVREGAVALKTRWREGEGGERGVEEEAEESKNSKKKGGEGKREEISKNSN